MNAKRRWLQFRLRSLLLFVFVICLALGLWRGWEYLPGTLYFDSQGYPHGTGKKEYFYDVGPLMKEEWYRAGILMRGKWYRPDGSVVAESIFDQKTGGIDYYLRQDGTVRAKMSGKFDPTERMYFADGPATYYTSDGKVEKVVEYRLGVKVEVK